MQLFSPFLFIIQLYVNIIDHLHSLLAKGSLLTSFLDWLFWSDVNVILFFWVVCCWFIKKERKIYALTSILFNHVSFLILLLSAHLMLWNLKNVWWVPFWNIVVVSSINCSVSQILWTCKTGIPLNFVKWDFFVFIIFIKYFGDIRP